MPSMSSIIQSRFFSAYYVLNGLMYVAFLIYRFASFKHVSVWQPIDITLSLPGVPGLSKWSNSVSLYEYHIYLMVASTCLVKYFNSATIDIWISTCFLYMQTAILVVLYFVTSARYAVYFGTLFFMISVLAPPPRREDPDTIQVMNAVSFHEQLANAKRAKLKNYHIIQIYASWSPLCNQLAPLFADMSLKYSKQDHHHLRINFAKIDVSRWPAVAESLDIDVSGTSKQLPTFIVYRMGEEWARIPAVRKENNKKTVISLNMKSLTASALESHLRIKEVIKEVDEWTGR